MKKVMIYLSALILLFTFASCQKEITGKDASKELYDNLKSIYEKALAEKGDMPIDKVVKCREELEKKYAEQLKNETFKKEYDAQNEVYKKDLEKIVQQYQVKQTVINPPADTAAKLVKP